MEGLLVNVKTPPILREFLISRNNGSDILKVDCNDVFARKILCLLEPTPFDCKIQTSNESDIKVEISFFKCGNTMVWPEHKSYLSEQSQNSLVYDWNKTFKEIFFNYVIAFCKGMNFKIPCQKKAIMSFCIDYNIPWNDITYDTMEKSWKRSHLRKKYKLNFKRARFEFYREKVQIVLSPIIKN